MAKCVKYACKGIGEAIIGSTFIVGCVRCPKFPENARRTNSNVQLYKYKLRKLGIRV